MRGGEDSDAEAREVEQWVAPCGTAPPRREGNDVRRRYVYEPERDEACLDSRHQPGFPATGAAFALNCSVRRTVAVYVFERVRPRFRRSRATST